MPNLSFSSRNSSVAYGKWLDPESQKGELEMAQLEKLDNYLDNCRVEGLLTFKILTKAI